MKYIVTIAATALSLAAAGPGFAEMQITSATYECERGVTVPATYLTSSEDAAAVIHVENRQIVLMITRAASGSRYQEPGEGSGYVWWTKGDEATLFWSDAEKSEEVTLYAACRTN